MAEAGIYDVIILDRMLPNVEGVEILKYLRAKGILAPVIFLTAKDAVSSRIEGLDAGADDYLIKPFSKDELLARVRALSRRSANLLTDKKISIASLCLDMQSCEAVIKHERTKLSVTEVQLLELLMRNKGQVLTKEQILDRIWGSDFLLASDKFHSEFISMQKGYISRKLLVDGEMWSDLVVWETMDDAKNAAKVIYENAAAGEYISFIDDEKSSDEDILYFSVEKSY